MKVCPRCGRDYVDELGYCLEDGTPLSSAPAKITERKTEEFAEPTFVRSAQTFAASARPPQSRSSNKLGIFLVIGILLLGLLVIMGAGLAGIWFYITSKNEVVRSDNQTERPGLNGTSNVKLSNTAVGINRSPHSTPSPVSNTLNPTPVPSPDRGSTPVNKISNSDPPHAKPEKTPSPPKTISGGVLNGKAISLPKPPFPPAARAVRASGSVNVQVLIDESGNVISAVAVSGHPLLRSAAAAAARGAKFSPTSLAGHPVKVSGVITYNFVP